MNTNIKISSPPKTTTPPSTPLYIDDSTDNFLRTNPHNGIPEYCMEYPNTIHILKWLKNPR